jgi:feruloyl esterase
MRFDVPLVTVLYGAAAYAAAVPPADRRARPARSLDSEISQIEAEIASLEQELEKDLEELEDLSNNPSQPGNHGSSGSGSTRPSPVSSLVVASSNPAAAAGSTVVLSSASSLAAASSSTSSLAASDSSVLLSSLSRAASSLSSALSSVEATTTLPATSSSLVTPGSTTVVDRTSLVSPVAATTSTASSNSASSTLIQKITANSTSSFPTFTASGSSGMAPTALANASVSSNITSAATCASLCSSLTFSSEYTVTPYTCEAYEAGTNVTITGGQATAACGTEITVELGICRVTLGITTSGSSATYAEVWLPNDNTTAWNGRTMSVGNGGLNGCVDYDQLQYLTGFGYAGIGDNAGHNSSAFDGSAFLDNNEVVLDWAYRARHEAVQAGKDIVKQFYGEEQQYSYYIGCSAGGAQGLQSAQLYPNDFDGIIAGSPAADMNHLQDWSARFYQLTGADSSDARYLTEDQWIFVQSYVFSQCDAAIDGVDDGILEDPTLCQFNTSAIPVCEGNSTDSCLTSTQINTISEVFTELYNTEGQLLFPALLYGSQVDAFRLGLLSGSTQGIAHDWFAYAVYNNTNFDLTNLNQTDYAYADSLNAYHGNASQFNGDLSAFKAAGGKLLVYHGLTDPMVTGTNSQRYYLKVAKTLGITDNTEMDPFMRLFRISGMAHCGVGGISGAGAWMFGQTAEADADGVAENVVDVLANWVEKDSAPDTLTGTKFWYDEPSLGLEFERPHCRFPYRTTYTGSGNWEDASSWNCTFIDNWQDCEVGAHPRLCNADGTFE